jgi:hypothetical protein
VLSVAYALRADLVVDGRQTQIRFSVAVAR